MGRPAGRLVKPQVNILPTEANNVRFSIENPRALLYTNNVRMTKSDWYLGAWTGCMYRS